MAIAVLVLVLVLGAVVAVLAFNPSASHFDANSPEAAFQRYLSSYQQRDFATSYSYFSARSQQLMSFDDYRSYAQSSGIPRDTSASRVIANRVEQSGSTTTLYLTVENQSDAGLSVNRWSYQVAVPMVQEPSGWKIDQMMLGTNLAPVPPVLK